GSGEPALPDWARLLGIAIIVIGFALKLRTTLVVVAAALATGLLAGLPLFTSGGREGIVEMLGRAFTENRLLTLFIITLPAIGLTERYGLQEQSARLIAKVRAATVGRLQIVYQLFRVLHAMLGIRLNCHPLLVGNSPFARRVAPPARPRRRWAAYESRKSRRRALPAGITAISLGRTSLRFSRGLFLFSVS